MRRTRIWVNICCLGTCSWGVFILLLTTIKMNKSNLHKVLAGYRPTHLMWRHKGLQMLQSIAKKLFEENSESVSIHGGKGMEGLNLKCWLSICLRRCWLTCWGSLLICVYAPSLYASWLLWKRKLKNSKRSGCPCRLGRCYCSMGEFYEGVLCLLFGDRCSLSWQVSIAWLIAIVDKSMQT